jgi:hypothetical protein
MHRSAMAFAMSAAIASSTACAKTAYLVVAASSDKPAAIAEKARGLTLLAPKLIVVDTRDCGAPRSVFAVVTDIVDSRQEADGALARVKPTVADAYIKACDIKPGSLLSFRISAVDPSISQVPSDAVNWDDGDRVSSALPLDPASSIVVVRSFDPADDSPLEGRSERILLAKTSGERVPLTDQCTNMARPSIAHGVVTFECARESAGDQLLHSVLVVDESGRLVTEVHHCREPSWSTGGNLQCMAESVAADGKLTLKGKLIQAGR